ncbi:MAG: ABC transporter ATP-binding protein [Bacteroidetes bacterium]|nr:ABC transporter ATP-binding protein [Bacteroidota bacterium]
MTDSVIKVESLGKKFIIAHEKKERYTAMRDIISERAKKIFRGGGTNNISTEEFWALKDVSFEIKRGEAVGIIGRNGAGKSTLLKILSRITEPSTGRIEMNGRVASLLEVGTGFHPELTGRENIFLNGAILGMSRVEIKRKFDEIVDFSGVEKFLDTPVKRYSSGMYVRLAFAVAAHLEPEILVVDEVLAVGDAEFQKKCLGKMNEVSKKEGRTVLFVSHQLSAIRNLCNRAILLSQGKTIFQGNVDAAIAKYLENKDESIVDFYSNDAGKAPENFFKKIFCRRRTIGIGDDLGLEIEYFDFFNKKEMVINVMIFDSSGELMAHIINDDDEFSSTKGADGKVNIILKNINFPAGKYFLSFWAGFDMSYGVEHLDKIIGFEIEDNTGFIKRSSPYPASARIIIQSQWSRI